MSHWEKVRQWVTPDPSRPLEGQLFQRLCLLGGVLSMGVVIPMNSYQNLSPWVNRGVFVLGLGSLLMAWAASRGHFYTKTMFLLLVGCLDFGWFPNGGSQGSIGLYFFTAALYLVLFFKGPFRVLALGLLVANVLGLHLVERAWPQLVTPFHTATDRLLDLGTSYVICLPTCALMLWVILQGFHGRTAQHHASMQALLASEGRLKLDEARLRCLLDTFPYIVWMKDAEGRFISVNQAFVETFKQKSIEDLIGKTDFDITDRALAQNYVDDDFKVMASKTRLDTEEEIIDQDVRKWFETHKSPIFDATGQVIGTAGFSRDITERRQAEQAIRESESRYRTQFDLASEGIFAATPEGCILEANEAFARMHGYSREAMVGLRLEDLCTPASAKHIHGRMRRLLAGESLTFQTEHLHNLGHAFPLEVSASLMSSNGEPSVLWFHRDISERLRMEEERRNMEAMTLRNDKMKSLGSLAGGVAHDMNNVLGAILAMASVHHMKNPPDTPVHRDMDTIIKACQRGASLVKGLLGFAREGLAQEQELDLNAVVRDEVRLLERTTLQKVHLVMDLAPALHLIKGDPAALSHALMNLCVNAVDAMPTGGTLTLRTWNRDDASLMLEVSDTGHGMPKDVLDRALDPFFTTKPQGKGTGLGLSIVYATVKAHQGTLDIQSESGRGTRVSMCFRACSPRSLNPEAKVDARVMPVRQAKVVLLIDDDPLIQDAFHALLEQLGHTAIKAYSGESALAELGAGLQPDVVILDMNMPGLDGAGTLPRLRELRPGVPVLLTTGRVDQAALDLVERHPGVMLLPKPFGLEELHKGLESVPVGGPQSD